MEQLYWKMDLNAKCPYCGHEYFHTFYINADTLICYNEDCGKEFNIEIYVENIQVKSSK